MIWLRYTLAAFLLFSVIHVGTRVAEVVGGSVSCINHVSCFNKFNVCSGDGLCPDHSCVIREEVQL